jgi:hypothetical protein
MIKRAAELSQGSVVVLDHRIGVNGLGETPELPWGTFEVIEVEQGDDGLTHALGTFLAQPGLTETGTMVLVSAHEVNVSPACIYRTGIAAYSAYREDDLPGGLRYAFPSGASYVVTRPSGMPLMAGYIYEKPGGDRPFGCHHIDSAEIADATCLLGAVMLIAGEIEKREAGR